MIPRFLYKKYVVASIIFIILFFGVLRSSPSVDQKPVNGNQHSRPNLDNQVAGKQNNQRLWDTIYGSSPISENLGGRVYDYLFTGGNSKPASFFHAEKQDENLTFDTFLHQLFGKIFALKPTAEDLANLYSYDENGDRVKVPTSGMEGANKKGFTMAFLKQFIRLGEEDLSDLKSKHGKFVDFVKQVKLPYNFYNKGSSGIIYVGGGRFTWFALLSISNVRKTGSNLPIEVFIPSKDEYEYVVCEEILPKMNAKCVLMYEFLKDQEQSPSVFKNFEFKGFTFKSLALLLSSFENVLLLDADNVPYFNPDTLFNTEPYASDKFVLWPDYWQRTTSPYFYDIASIDLLELNKDNYTAAQIASEIPLHKLRGSIPNPSTESGQLMISKSKHWDVILLSLYYNIYGPDHYYHLLSQGAAGQGDKETFLAAATVLNSTAYQVTAKVSAIGYFKKDGGDYRGTAQGQKSSIQDFEQKQILSGLLTSKYFGKKTNDKLSEIDGLLAKYSEDELSDDEWKTVRQYVGIPEPEIIFIHESTPKLDPIQLIHDNEFINDEVTDPATGKPKRIRFYGNYITKKNNYQFEKLQIGYIHNILCERSLVIRFIEEQINKYYVKEGKDFDKEVFCKKLDEQQKWLGSIEFTD